MGYLGPSNCTLGQAIIVDILINPKPYCMMGQTRDVGQSARHEPCMTGQAIRYWPSVRILMTKFFKVDRNIPNSVSRPILSYVISSLLVGMHIMINKLINQIIKRMTQAHRVTLWVGHYINNLFTKLIPILNFI